MTGICRREAGRDDPADFRSSQFLAEEGLFSKQAEEPRRFTRAPVTTRWFVFVRPLICLDSILSEGLVSKCQSMAGYYVGKSAPPHKQPFLHPRLFSTWPII